MRMNNMELEVDTKGESLRKLFIEQLKDLYDAENQLVKALPKMVKVAQSQELKDAFSAHLGETENHVERIEQIFQLFGNRHSLISQPQSSLVILFGSLQTRKISQDAEFIIAVTLSNGKGISRAAPFS